jgi:flavin-dependent trigonelline monooxygenase, reductase component
MVTAEAFRAALRTCPTGVTVVTTWSDDAVPVGMTVSAFCSVSLDPPLLLVCVGRGSSLDAPLQEDRCFAVNVLGGAQGALSDRFARRGGERFADVPHHRDHAGIPVLDDVVAVFRCRVRQRHDAGDHAIVVGGVEAVRVGDAAPLLYHRGRYASMHDTEGAGR